MFYKNDVKIDAFIQIPKVLFRDERYKKLPLICKIAYSIYVTRYSITKYKDNIGPYIIYSDRELAAFIDTTPEYVREVRKRLRDAGLIDYKRSVGNNKIYIYSYSNSAEDDKIFFYENTLDSWQFYRFPTELFDEKFINLPLNAKFLYVMFLDMMFLSINYNYKDSKDRIYFSEDSESQELKANLSARTIKKYRDYLKACRLLAEYKPFGKPMRFYLLRLEMYQDNVFQYENMTQNEQKTFLKNITEDFADKYIRKKDTRDISSIKQLLKENNITQKEAVQIYMKETGKSLSVSGLRKYLNGTRQMPDDVFKYFSDPAIWKKTSERNGKKDTFSSENKSDTNCQITYELMSRKVPNIIYTEEKELNEKNNIKISIFNDEETKNEIQFHTSLKDMIHLIHNFSHVTPVDKSFLVSSFEMLDTKKTFYHKKDDTYLNQKEISELLNMIKDPELFFVSILNSMASYTFETPERQINYFLAVMIDKLLSYKKGYSWFRNSTVQLQIYIDRNYDIPSEFSEEVMNYNMFDKNN